MGKESTDYQSMMMQPVSASQDALYEETSGFTDMAEEYGAEQVVYAHCHGESRFRDSIHGEYRGRMYHLVSGDYLRWKPLRILE